MEDSGAEEMMNKLQVTDAQGNSVSELLSDLILQITESRQEDALEHFEEILSKCKEKAFHPEQPETPETQNVCKSIRNFIYFSNFIFLLLSLQVNEDPNILSPFRKEALDKAKELFKV